MVTPIAPEPVVPTHTQLGDHRHRPAAGERTVLPQSTPPARKPPDSARQFPQREDQQRRQDEPAKPDASASFAAAVISGTLPPRPESMAELVRRIGSAPIPPEYQARLKDLSV
ncbi:MAG TPA: hypothetical protein VGN79_13345 [Devosia sp.]|jgi:hypothetical protein|nr:hypothetical protein [Devosia sp.]